jgi:enamine deaminase RidA (YjgF/YER057c/UK114 family)
VTVPAALTPPHLSVQRLTPSQWSALAASATPPLGALGYGMALTPGLAAVAARPLGAGGACIDAWCSPSQQVSAGQCGSVHWRHDGHWLFGSLQIDEALDADGGMQALAQRAYQDVFATLSHTGCEHLLRLWNYLPDINGDGGGLERYRQFNLGRQQAFVEAQHPAFEGAPAACALGTPGGPFCVHFLAGRTRPLQVENPRQVSAYHYPSEYGPRSPSFSRAAVFDAGEGQVALLISGTASIVGHTSMHAGDVAAQTRETLRNLEAVLGAARQRSTAHFELDRLSLTVYVRHASDAPQVLSLLGDTLGTDAMALRDAVLLQGDVCRRELLVEIEAHAFAPGEVRA